MKFRYNLRGTFVEACNCIVICPCWVEDEPTEKFCAGLFAWTFADGSLIQGRDVGGHSLVSVTVHGDARRGNRSESAVFVGDGVDQQAADLLVQAFAGQGGGPLADLAGVTGDVVWKGRAHIEVGHAQGGYQVSVAAPDGASFLRAVGGPTHFDTNAEPLTLHHTALHAELGIGSEPVTAHRSRELTIGIAALPGGAIDEVNRSGMTGSFRYVSSATDDDDD